MNEDGSINESEYRELSKRMNAEDDKQATSADRSDKLSTLSLSRAFELAQAGEKRQVSVVFSNDEPQIHYAHMRNEANVLESLVITDVHNLPTRVRCKKKSVERFQTATNAMIHQQDTGCYPTVEDHQAKRSLVYTIVEDDTGHLATKPL